jgi:hypothetical protein
LFGTLPGPTATEVTEDWCLMRPTWFATDAIPVAPPLLLVVLLLLLLRLPCCWAAAVDEELLNPLRVIFQNVMCLKMQAAYIFLRTKLREQTTIATQALVTFHSSRYGTGT